MLVIRQLLAVTEIAVLALVVNDDAGTRAVQVHLAAEAIRMSKARLGYPVVNVGEQFGDLGSRGFDMRQVGIRNPSAIEALLDGVMDARALLGRCLRLC